MITNKDVRVEGSNLIINGEKHPLDPAVIALIKRANTVAGKLSALDTKLDSMESLEKTASGNPISLIGAAEAYAMGLSMTIEAIQSGSGDPSPTNVRPISGISTATVQTTNGTDTNTASITLGQTVYGGTVDFKTGGVTVTHEIVNLGTLTWEYWTNDVFIANVADKRATTQDSIICDSYPTKDPNVSYVIADKCIFNLVGNETQRRYIYIANSSYSHDATGASALKASLSGMYAVYELATPVTLTLTPAQLELLKGANTISGNGVTISIDYLGR